MPGELPVGEPVPRDGSLPEGVSAGKRPFALYIHIPFCARRCGYCDFNTYTIAELGGDESIEKQYVDALVKEIALARSIVGDQQVTTIFFGGGTPTLLPSSEIARILDAVQLQFRLSDDVEITTEANPDSVTSESLRELRAAGINRISFGVQSTTPHVLQTLDRTHNPAQVPNVVHAARDAGFTHISVDLIYGTPGETIVEWEESVRSLLTLPIDHISAYSLIVEEGTKLGTQVRRGALAMPDEDLNADKYIVADDLFTAAGFAWYEVSNWAKPGGACKHNEMYWKNNDWWGLGAGAHSHVDGVRWWNKKLPAAYIKQLQEESSPALAREILTDEERSFEELMLGIRTREGLPLSLVSHSAAAVALADGNLEAEQYEMGRVVLTRSGRLIADALLRAFSDA
ncbi:MAG: coproporphyrinogen III oxidase [Actinobacteria bacterium]|nr:coproporphyrinogen III oxidase [Actinomycetota bacterium]MTB25751.1 coproporphyrinogen III oxidase [Actinomycetota bacterium]